MARCTSTAKTPDGRTVRCMFAASACEGRRWGKITHLAEPRIGDPATTAAEGLTEGEGYAWSDDGATARLYTIRTRKAGR